MTEKRISFLLNIVVREMNSQADGLLRHEFGITYSQFAFLMTLSENPEIDVTRLAEALGVTKGAVSNRLKWFIQKGLVSSGHKPGNSKQVLINLSPDGLSLAQAAGAFLEKTFTATIAKSRNNSYKALTLELEKIYGLLLDRRFGENLSS
jgi:DNA-binding MarR family transcriptional regulator